MIVDLVLERVPKLNPDKMLIGQIRIDPPEEILANKLTTLVGPSEERDLIDVMLLEQAGYRVEDALGPALRKDGGCTPATLAWTLSQLTIPEKITLVAGVKGHELTQYIEQLIERLSRVSFP